jgi:hypothetical protein
MVLRQIGLCKDLRVTSSMSMSIMGMDTHLSTRNGISYVSFEFQVKEFDRDTLITLAKEALEVQRKICKV